MPNSLQYIPFYNTPVGVYILFFSSFANNAQGINTPACMQAVWSRVQIWKMSFSKSQAGDLTTRPFFFNSPIYQTDLHLAAYLICAVMLTDSSWTSGLPAGFLCGLAISTCSNTNRTILHSAKCITESSTPRRNEGTEHLDETSVPHASSLYFKSSCSLICDTSFPNKKARITQMTKAFGIWTPPSHNLMKFPMTSMAESNGNTKISCWDFIIACMCVTIFKVSSISGSFSTITWDLLILHSFRLSLQILLSPSSLMGRSSALEAVDILLSKRGSRIDLQPTPEERKTTKS